jgi:hypothetical protein
LGKKARFVSIFDGCVNFSVLTLGASKKGLQGYELTILWGTNKHSNICPSTTTVCQVKNRRINPKLFRNIQLELSNNMGCLEKDLKKRLRLKKSFQRKFLSAKNG